MMACFLVRRKLSLYVSDDLPAPMKSRIARHLYTCRRCRVEANQLRVFRERLAALQTVSCPAGVLDHFPEEVMERIVRLQSEAPAPAPSMLQTFALSLSFKRAMLVGLLVVLSLCAFFRHDRLEGLLTRQEMARSVVTQNGMIVSDAHLQGRAANVKVFRVAGSDMVIIWLDASPVQSGRLRRG